MKRSARPEWKEEEAEIVFVVAKAAKKGVGFLRKEKQCVRDSQNLEGKIARKPAYRGMSRI